MPDDVLVSEPPVMVPASALPKTVLKRDGSTAPFDLAKIARAIAKAGAATGEFGGLQAELIAERVGRVIAHRFSGRAPEIEAIQDQVEQALVGAGHFTTARAYIVYREKHKRLRDTTEDADRRRPRRRRVPRAARLAGQCQRQPGLLARRADPQRLGQGGRELLARPRLRARGRPRAPRRRRAHPRPRHAGRLLRRLVAAPVPLRGSERRSGQGRGRAAEAHVERGGADRQLPRHAAERVGGRAGVLVVRHLHGAVRPQGPDELRRR